MLYFHIYCNSVFFHYFSEWLTLWWPLSDLIRHYYLKTASKLVDHNIYKKNHIMITWQTSAASSSSFFLLHHPLIIFQGFSQWMFVHSIPPQLFPNQVSLVFLVIHVGCSFIFHASIFHALSLYYSSFQLLCSSPFLSLKCSATTLRFNTSTLCRQFQIHCVFCSLIRKL